MKNKLIGGIGISVIILIILTTLIPTCTATKENDDEWIILGIQVTKHETIIFLEHKETGEHWNLIIPHGWNPLEGTMPILIPMD